MAALTGTAHHNQEAALHLSAATLSLFHQLPSLLCTTVLVHVVVHTGLYLSCF